MTRAKSKPPVRKPVFDEAGILSFAAGETIDAAGSTARTGVTENPGSLKGAQQSDQDRLSLTLMLKHEVITRLTAEADRKDKTVDQIVEKLVTKHLGKH
ncbi:MAG TPA: hypothetical protein VL949_12715 [Geobacteraceae bacterium]|nr:hypothetical protein [Geobacteraceae bacterium]